MLDVIDIRMVNRMNTNAIEDLHCDLSDIWKLH